MTTDSKLFKDVFFKVEFINEFSAALATALPKFNAKKFQQQVFDNEWKNKELKQRVSHIVSVLKDTLPDDYPQALSVILKATQHLKSQKIKEVSFGYVCLPEYIQVYGLEHYKESIAAIEEITQFVTCEFAVRPFIVKYGDKMMKQMLRWSKHKNAKVRRLSSEGCRPRLPWAMALPDFKKDPSPILPILENLKTDKDIWVQKTVANNLNDISKDNPELAIKIFKRWVGECKETDWVVKHAARTLLKQGNAGVMAIFGLKMDKAIEVSNFKIETHKVKMGGDVHFSFTLSNNSKKEKLIRVEYAMYYLRANGTHSKKVFKISEKNYLPQSNTYVERRQSFKAITTRVYYAGVQKLSVIINGHELTTGEFKLVE